MAKDKKKSAQPVGIVPLEQAELEISGQKSILRGMLIRAVIAVLGLSGVVGSFVSMFAIPVKMTVPVMASVIYIFLFGAALYRKNDWKFALPCMAVFWLAALRLFKIEIVCGYKIVANYVCEKINQNSNLNLLFFDLKGVGNQGYYVLVFLVLALFPVACGVAVSTLRKPKIIPLFLITFPFLELGLFFGLEPWLASVVMYLASLCAVCAMQLTAHKNRRANTFHNTVVRRANAAGVGAVMFSMIIVLAWTGTMFFPPEEYSHQETVEKIRSDVDEMINSFNSPKETVGGGINNGRLGTVDKISYNYQKALELEMFPQNDTLYLKGYVGSVYTGNSWEPLPESDYASYREINPEFFKDESSNKELQNLSVTYQLLADRGLGDAAENSFENILVKNVSAASQYAYVPYSVDWNVDTVSTHFDSYAVPVNGAKEFSFTIYGNKGYGRNRILKGMQPLEWANPYVDGYQESVKFGEFENLYRDFVNDVYKRLPEQGNERLMAECEECFANVKVKTTENIVKAVRNYLKKYADYSLEAGRLPEGEDFVDWFLYENHKGSCTHFASAAVLMLRYAGVPARYVEGYIVTNKDYSNGASLGMQVSALQHGKETVTNIHEKRRVEVKDCNAHAWAEIYIRGYGWIPMEFTPGFSNREINIPDDSDKPTRSRPNVTKPSTTTGASETTAVKQSTQTTTEKSGVVGRQDGSSSSGDFRAKKLLALLLLLLALAALFCLAIVVRHAFALRRRRLRMNASKGECIVYFYEEITALFDYLNLVNAKNVTPLEYAKMLDAEHSEKLPKPFTPIASLILHAQFSTAHITGQEKSTVLEYLRALSRKTYEALPPLKKLVFRYYKNLYW